MCVSMFGVSETRFLMLVYVLNMDKDMNIQGLSAQVEHVHVRHISQHITSPDFLKTALLSTPKRSFNLIPQRSSQGGEGG